MAFQVLGDYIRGQFITPRDPIGTLSKISPADLSDAIGIFPFSFNSIDTAVEAAAEAFKSWRATKFEERKRLLLQFKAQLEKHRVDLENIICREVGKPAWEAQTEITSMMNKIDITLSEGMNLIKPFEVPNAAKGALCRCRYKPRGVMAILGPFNFPGHLPHGHVVPALATGNCVVFKPSELTPGVGQIYAEIIHQSGFPPGVFNLVQGNGRIGGHLVKHPLIDGILFTGSYEIGLKIQQETFHDYWKIRALEMGGKNAAIILDDASLEKAISDTLQGAFLTTGQRCSSTSRILVHRKIASSFVERFHEIAKHLIIDHPHAESFGRKAPFMGPLISANAQEKYLKFQDIATREGAERIMRGKTLERQPEGYYVSPSIYVIKQSDPKSVYQQTEIFGPNVAFFPVDGLEEAIEIANQSSYGLALSIFTASQQAYEKAFELSKTGLVNWNTSTVGASSKLPFGGLLKSGNNRPTALFATQYCTYPVAELLDSSPFDPSKLPP